MNTIICKQLKKYKDLKGKIVGYYLGDRYGNTQYMLPGDLKEAIKAGKIKVVNLTLTKDGRLVDGAEPKEPKEKTLGDVYKNYNLGRYASLSVNDPRVVIPNSDERAFRQSEYEVVEHYKNKLFLIKSVSGDSIWRTLNDIKYSAPLRNAIYIKDEALLIPKNIKELPEQKVPTQEVLDKANKIISTLKKVSKSWVESGNIIYNQFDYELYGEEGFYSFVRLNAGKEYCDKGLSEKFNKAVKMLEELKNKYEWIVEYEYIKESEFFYTYIIVDGNKIKGDIPQFHGSDIESEYSGTDFWYKVEDYKDAKLGEGYRYYTNDRDFALRQLMSKYREIGDMCIDMLMEMDDEDYAEQHDYYGLPAEKPQSIADAWRSLDIDKVRSYFGMDDWQFDQKGKLFENDEAEEKYVKAYFNRIADRVQHTDELRDGLRELLGFDDK